MQFYLLSFYFLYGILSFESVTGKNLQIVNGNQASLNPFPYLAHIQFSDNSSINWICGGSLITTKHVLTSGRCAYQAIKATIILGAVNINLKSEPTRQTFEASKITTHEDFNEDIYFNDIAIIELNNKVVPNNVVNVIQLASSDLLDQDLTGQNVTISGWGRIETAGSFSPTLKYGNISVVEIRRCEERYLDLVRRERQICTVDEIDDNSATASCEGDFGGPMVINNTLYGIQSFASPIGCQVGYETVNSMVAYYLDWINSIISN